MTKKSGILPEEIRKQFDRIKNAEAARNEADEQYGFSRAQAEYEGDYLSSLPSFVSNVDLIPINEVYGFIKTFIPTVYSRNPHITINPKAKEHIASSKILELALNSYWLELRLKRQMRRAIFDAVVAEGWMKVGYTAVFGKNQNEEGKPKIEPSEYIQNEEIFATRVSWRNMVRDPDAVEGLADSRWVAQQIFKPLYVIEQSSAYKNKGKITPTLIVSTGKGKKDKLSPNSTTLEYVEMWELWDRDAEKVYLLSEGADNYLKDPMPWPYDMEGFPYGLLQYNENPDRTYCPNLIAAWEPQLWEKMKVRAMQLDHIKRFSRQMQVKKGSLERSEMDKYKKAQTGAIIEYTKTPLESIPYPPFQSDAYAIENRIDLDKDNISGQPNAVRSAPQRTQSRTLGEIDRLISAFQSRQIDPQTVTEDFAAEIAYKLIAVIKQYLPGKKFIRATNMQAQDIITAFPGRFDGISFYFTKQDIRKTEFDVEVKVGSSLPLDRQNRIETLTGLLKVGQYLGITPGDNVSTVVGKTLMSELEAKEIETAYDEKIKQMEIARKLQKAALRGQVEMKGQRIAAEQDALARGMSPVTAPAGLEEIMGEGNAMQ